MPWSVTKPAEPATPHLVPACAPCNQAKADKPSSCYCDTCFAAKALYAPLWWLALPEVRLPVPDPPEKPDRKPKVRTTPLPAEVAWCFRCDVHHLVGVHTLPRRARAW